MRRGLARLLDDERIVQQVERLRRDVARAARALRRIDVAEIEHLEKFEPLVAEGRRIDAAPRVGELVFVFDVLRARVVCIDLARAGDVRPAHVQPQLAADREDRVAKLLGIEPAAVRVREQAIVGIGGKLSVER